jgi:predicted DNA-binding transcriptional regulator YafY
MGKRSGTETVARLLVAFLRQPRWSQAELERVCDVKARALRRALRSLELAGVPLVRREGSASRVLWRVEKGWAPALACSLVDPEAIARLVARLPRSEERQTVLGRLLAPSGAAALATNQAALEVSEATLRVLEDAWRKRLAVRMAYFSASRGAHAIRTVSVQRITYGEHVRFVAHCHARKRLLWFRADRVTQPEPLDSTGYVEVDARQVDELLRESLDGFRGQGDAVRCRFDVAYPDAAWALRCLPSVAEGAVVQHAPSGAHVELTTAGIDVLARFLVGLGAACSGIAPDALRARVAELARGALGAAGANALRRTGPNGAGRIGPRRGTG